MFFRRVYEPGLAHASYIVGCQATKNALVIDPKRDIDTYLEIAEQEDLEITHIAETHIHADFLSGSRELQAATGAELLLSDEGDAEWQYQFDHTGLREGDSFKVGNLRIDVIHTPGHTPEHISFLLTDLPAGDHPVMIFTGDFVFVGDVGRPDLLEEAAGYKGTKEAGARSLFHSLKKFKSLPDYVQVWPAHGAGSACGKALGAVPSSTVGYEKMVNWAMRIEDEEQFVDELLEGQPEPPKYFAMMKKLNKVGPAVLGGIPHPARLTANQFLDKMKNEITVIDTRDKLSFAGGHFPGSINIQDNNAFSTWAGWLLDYENPFLLVAPDHRIEDLTKALIRIGLDNVAGYIRDMDSISQAGRELDTIRQLTCSELKENLNTYTVLDVRGKTEYNEGHIPNAMNIHAGQLLDNLERIPSDRPLLVHCASGDRSSIAASLLKANGFDNVTNLTNGINGWMNSNPSLIERETEKMEEAV